MTPYERLLAEAIPTGTFGDAQPAVHPTPGQPRPWTALEQLEHRQALETALDGWHDTTDPRHHRHLTPVPDQPAA